MPAKSIPVPLPRSVNRSRQAGWTEPHETPADVRRYRFILTDEQAASGRLTLCVGRPSDRVIDRALFRDDGAKIALFFNGAEPTVTRDRAFANRICLQHAGNVPL